MASKRPMRWAVKAASNPDTGPLHIQQAAEPLMAVVRMVHTFSVCCLCGCSRGHGGLPDGSDCPVPAALRAMEVTDGE